MTVVGTERIKNSHIGICECLQIQTQTDKVKFNAAAAACPFFPCVVLMFGYAAVAVVIVVVVVKRQKYKVHTDWVLTYFTSQISCSHIVPAPDTDTRFVSKLRRLTFYSLARSLSLSLRLFSSVFRFLCVCIQYILLLALFNNIAKEQMGWRASYVRAWCICVSV